MEDTDIGYQKVNYSVLGRYACYTDKSRKSTTAECIFVVILLCVREGSGE